MGGFRALMGPWDPWLHEPKDLARPVWDLTKAIVDGSGPCPIRREQIAILVTGAHFDAAYEIYAHIAVAEHEGMSDHSAVRVCFFNIKPNDLANGGKRRL